MTEFTPVSGTIGGSTYGVAKAVTIHGVRVLDCNGSGSNSGVIAGVDWVTANHVAPAVAKAAIVLGCISLSKRLAGQSHHARRRIPSFGSSLD